MNWSKNLYVFMLGALIVFSGCIGTGTTDGQGDADTSGTTVINNYYNNTTVIENTPEYITDTGSGPNGLSMVTINQSAGTAIHLLDWSGTIEYRTGSSGNWTGSAATSLRVNTNCANGMTWDETLSYNYESSNDQWLAGTGLECTHNLTPQRNAMMAELRDGWMSAIYQIAPVVVA